MKREGFTAVAIILIVAIVLVVAGGIWYYEANGHSSVQTQISSQSSSTTTNISTSSYHPPEVSFSVSPSTIVAGEGATLTWSSTDAMSCGFTGTNAAFTNASWSNEGLSSSGSKIIIPYYSSTSTYTAKYQMVCANQSGTSAPATGSLTVLSTPQSSQPYMDPTSVMVDGGPEPGLDVVIIGTGIGASSTIQISGNGYLVTVNPSIEAWEGATERISFDLPSAITNSTSTYSVKVISGGVTSNPVNITPVQNAQG